MLDSEALDRAQVQTLAEYLERVQPADPVEHATALVELARTCLVTVAQVLDPASAIVLSARIQSDLVIEYERCMEC